MVVVVTAVHVQLVHHHNDHSAYVNHVIVFFRSDSIRLESVAQVFVSVEFKVYVV